MSDYDSLNHSTWECKYHIVWIPKYRRKKLYATIRENLGQEIRRLAACRECSVLEGNMMIDHVYMLIEVSPKYSIAQGMWIYQGKKRDIHRIKVYTESGSRRREVGPEFGLVPRTVEKNLRQPL